MTGIVAAVRARVAEGCVVRGCRKSGCNVSLEDAPENRCIVDFDKPESPIGPSETRCDYLFLAECPDSGEWVVPIELKKEKAHITGARKQLQADANAAEQLVPSNVAANANFRPVLASGNMPKAERREMQKHSNRVRLFGRWEFIRRIACGSALMSAFRG